MRKIYPIVGANYHRPAKAIFAVLPTGATLEVIPEPENQYDPNAIAVWIEAKNIPPHTKDELQNLSQRYGFTADEILNGEYWQLGFLPREIAAELQPFKATTGKFSVGANGGPRVELELPGQLSGTL